MDAHYDIMYFLIVCQFLCTGVQGVRLCIPVIALVMFVPVAVIQTNYYYMEFCIIV